jgi:MFS family permease
MIHAVLPLFLVSGLGASVALVGLIEGIAEAAASILKVFSGAISDYWQRRKVLTVFGYGLSTAVKPLFMIANSPSCNRLTITKSISCCQLCGGFCLGERSMRLRTWVVDRVGWARS